MVTEDINLHARTPFVFSEAGWRVSARTEARRSAQRIARADIRCSLLSSKTAAQIPFRISFRREVSALQKRFTFSERRNSACLRGRKIFLSIRKWQQTHLLVEEIRIGWRTVCTASVTDRPEETRQES